MNGDEIYRLVLDELAGIPYFENFHGISTKNINDYLVTPYKKRLFNPLDKTVEEHWVVLDEERGNKSGGYLIFFSEADHSFGLGTKTNLQNLENVGGFIMLCGSFMDTISMM